MPAPAAAPAAPVTPAPSTPPVVAPGVQPTGAKGSATADAYSKIDSLFGVQPDEQQQPPPPDETDEKGNQKPPEDPPKPDDKGDKGVPPKPDKAASLREAKDRIEAENKNLRKENEDLKTKLKTPADDPEKKKLVEERDGLSKQIETLQNELKFAKYERTEEFETNYNKPFQEAYQNARKRVEGLKIKDPDTEDGAGNTVQGKIRQGTANDFDQLMGIVDDNDAWEYAQKVFNDKATIALQLREQVGELYTKRAAAIENFRKDGLANEKKKAEQTESETKEFRGLYEGAIKAAQEMPNLKEWFEVEEGDEKGKQLLEKGFKLADDAFGDTSQLTSQARANLYAAMRNRAAVAGLLFHKFKKFAAENSELKKKLEEFEDSEPNLDGKGGKGGKGGAKPTGLAAFDAAVDSLAK